MCGICLIVKQSIEFGKRSRANDKRNRESNTDCGIQTKSEEEDYLSFYPCAFRGQGDHTALFSYSDYRNELRIPLLHSANTSSSRRSCNVEEEERKDGKEENRNVSCEGTSEKICFSFEELLRNLGRRGPEAFGDTQRVVEGTADVETQVNATSSDVQDGNETVEVKYSTKVGAIAAVLGLRGGEITRQPYEIKQEKATVKDKATNVSYLLWNGEIFGGTLCPPPWESDTALLARGLSELEQHCCSIELTAIPGASAGTQTEKYIRQRYFLSQCVQLLENEVEGPYGLMYHAAQLAMVVLGRDPLGRRSLLIHLATYPSSTRSCDREESKEGLEVELIICSVGVRHAFQSNKGSENIEERKKDIGQKKRTRTADDEGEEGNQEDEGKERCWMELPVTGLFGLLLDTPITKNLTQSAECQVGKFLHSKWRNPNHLCHPLLIEQENDSLLAENSFQSILPTLPSAFQLRKERARPQNPSVDQMWAHWAAVQYLHALSASLLRRCAASQSGVGNDHSCESLREAQRRPVCVLFSGGIDCTVLAALAHYLLPIETPIELVNVAFGAQPEQAPDRVAAKRAVMDLLRLPQPSSQQQQQVPTHEGVAEKAQDSAVQEREWRLVFVDVPTKQNTNSRHIMDLIYPCTTVMDFDIGSALWFAARGEGRMQILRPSDLKEASKPEQDDTFSANILCEPGRENIFGSFSKHIRSRDIHVEAPSVELQENADGNRSDSQQSRRKTPPMEAKEEHFGTLLNILVLEGQQGSGETNSVLLSTLGKEYASLLTPCWRSLGYKKLGNYLNEAVRLGLIAFDPTAPSKAIKLIREEDVRRAAPVPASIWVEGVQAEEGRRFPKYISQAKILLLGTGADETLGGYTRYRRFYERHGMAGTKNELERDFSRLWRRNLGRDDRITMDSGREPRFPFLDESLLKTLQCIVHERRKALSKVPIQLPPEHNLYANASVSATETEENKAMKKEKECHFMEERYPVQKDERDEDVFERESLSPILDFTLPPGEGDKRVLRTIARMIGLTSVTTLEKRAIQFGSRIAEPKQKGTSTLKL